MEVHTIRCQSFEHRHLHFWSQSPHDKILIVNICDPETLQTYSTGGWYKLILVFGRVHFCFPTPQNNVSQIRC